MKEIKLFVLIFIAAVVFGIWVKVPTSHFGDVGTGFRFTSATNTSAALSGSSSVILSKDSSRGFAQFTNDDAAIVEYVCFASTCTAGTGFRLATGQSLTINGNDQYTGDVSAIAASGTPNITIIRAP